MMKNVFLCSLMLFSFIVVSAQQEQKLTGPAPMKPEMTEFYEPEVRIIQPGLQPGMAPSDAIILFDGTDVNREWEDSEPCDAGTDRAPPAKPRRSDSETGRGSVDY